MRLLVRFMGFLFAAGTVLFLVGVGAVAGLIWHYSKDLPDYSQLQDYEPPVMTRVHASDGSLLAEYSKERRLYLPIQAVPKIVINAFLAAEDKNFYEHGGIDFTGMARAGMLFLQNYGSNKRPQGASTITQQVAKNFLLTNEDSFTRKIKEADAETARKEQLNVTNRANAAHIFAGEYFAEEVRRDVFERYGEKKLYEGGLSVRTTLDPKLQVMARKTMTDGLVKFDEAQGWRGAISKLDISGDWGVKLADVKSLSDISLWRMAVVLETSDQSSRIGFQPSRELGGAVSKERQTGLITLDGVRWAKAASGPTRFKTPTAVTQVLSPGAVVYADPLIGKDGA